MKLPDRDGLSAKLDSKLNIRTISLHVYQVQPNGMLVDLPRSTQSFLTQSIILFLPPTYLCLTSKNLIEQSLPVSLKTAPCDVCNYLSYLLKWSSSPLFLEATGLSTCVVDSFQRQIFLPASCQQCQTFFNSLSPNERSWLPVLFLIPLTDCSHFQSNGMNSCLIVLNVGCLALLINHGLTILSKDWLTNHDYHVPQSRLQCLIHQCNCTLKH
jgi:hypothetical protein